MLDMRWYARRLWPWIAAFAVVIAIIGPALRSPPRDSYPLSTYPMFSHDRGRMSDIATVVGVADDGTTIRLTPSLIGGNDEVMLAVQTVSNAVRAGGDRPLELCEQVAGRVVASGPDDAEYIRVAVERYDAIDYLAHGEQEPRSVDIAAECEVDR